MLRAWGVPKRNYSQWSGLRRMGRRTQPVDRLGDQVACVSPSYVDRSIGCSYALVLPKRVTYCYLAVVVRRLEWIGGDRNPNVCRREIERRARHTNRSIDRKAAAAIVRIGYIEIDRSVAVLCVVADVHIIGILV